MQSLTYEPILQNGYKEDGHNQRYGQHNRNGIWEPLQEVVYDLICCEYQWEEGDADNECRREDTLDEFA